MSTLFAQAAHSLVSVLLTLGARRYDRRTPELLQQVVGQA